MRDYRKVLDQVLSPSYRPGGIKARPGTAVRSRTHGKRSWVNNNQLLEDLSTSRSGGPVSDDYYLDWDRSTRQADGCAATIGGDNPYVGLHIIYDWGVQDSDLPVLLVDITRDNQFKLEVPVPERLWQVGWVASGAVAADEVDRDICARQFADWVQWAVRNATSTESYALNTQLDRILNELDGGAGACGTDIIAEGIVQVMQPVGILDQRLIIEDQDADSVDLEAAVSKLKQLSATVDAPHDLAGLPASDRHPGVDITK